MRSLPSLLLLAVLFTPRLVQAGPLKDIEDSGRDKPTRDSNDGGSRGSSDRSSDDDDDDGDDGDSLAARFFMRVILMPYSLPMLLVDQPCLTRFAASPYVTGRGNLRTEEARQGCAATTPLPPSRPIAAQLALEGGYTLAFNSITAGTLSARLQLPYRVELSGRLSVLTDLKERPREQALMGTTHLSVRFAQAAHVELRSGLGLRAYGLNQPLYGFDFVYALDAFGKRREVASLEFHAGSLGHAGLVQGRLTVGYLLRNVELYAGYDHTGIHGSASTTRLSGPVLGLRAWF